MPMTLRQIAVELRQLKVKGVPAALSRNALAAELFRHANYQQQKFENEAKK